MTQGQPTYASRSLGARATRFRRRRFGPSDETRRLLPIFTPVVVCAAGVVAAAISDLAHPLPSLGTAVGVLVLLVIATIAEAFPVPIEGVSAGRTSLASVFIVAAAVLYGWAPATLLAATAMATVELGRRRPVSRVLYNTSLYALSAAAAGLVRELLDGTSLSGLLLATAVTSVAFYAVNITLLAIGRMGVGDEPMISVLKSFAASAAAPATILVSFALIVVALWDRSPLLIIALICPLGVIALHERWLHAALHRLRELDRLKNEFMAIVSHELRTPLASVYGAAMTLQRQDVDDKVRESMLAIIYRESARLAHLVDQVLWASRLEAGHLETSGAHFDGGELAAEVVDSARTHLVPGVEIELQQTEDVPHVAADADKVRHVLVNLVENAVKYSPDGGRIEVGVEQADSFVCFYVKDEGLGIPDIEQDRIFDKFHRLDPHLTRGVGGTGLGLYICRELVRQMNGDIWVVSTEGSGSTFMFELPAAVTNGAAAAESLER
jgi:signal transduction histidine kinase